MRRRNLLGLIGGIGIGMSGCLGNTNTNTAEQDQTEKPSTNTATRTRTSRDECGPHYLQYGEWHSAYRAGISVEEIRVDSELQSNFHPAT